MNLLAAKLYDPAVAVSKATSALLAMTALDTTNLRLAITVPAHGMVRFVLRCALEGATTFPQVLLGVLNGATVVARVTPLVTINGTALATTRLALWADVTVTGLTPGAMNVDAAYGVEILLAATNIKYGGPNNTTTDDAWGGFVFEAWDPQPQTANSVLAVDANGRVDVSKVLGTAQTAGDLKASLNTLQSDTDDIQTRLPAALVGGRMDASVGAMAANVVTAAAINAAARNGKGDWNIGKTGYALTAAEYIALVNLIWDELTSEGRTAGSFGQLLKDDLNATIASRAAPGAAMALVVDGVDAVALATSAAQEIADALLDRAAAIEGFTPRELARLFAAVLVGKADGMGTATGHFRDVADSKNRVTVTQDVDGNRTALVRDAT